MKLSEAERVVRKEAEGVKEVNLIEFKSLKCLEVVWEDGSTSLIPTNLFVGKKDEAKALREEIRELLRLKKNLEEVYRGSGSKKR